MQMKRLKILVTKLKTRIRRRKNQYRKWQENRKAGNLKQFRKEKKAAKKLRRMVKAQKKRVTPTGTGAWQGSKSIIQNEVMPVAIKWGIAKTSTKRWATFGNPGSDHFMLNLDAFAKDFATDSNYSFGVAIGKALGVSYRGAQDDYRRFYITRAGKRFRVQIICGTHGTGPHTHVGIDHIG